MNLATLLLMTFISVCGFAGVYLLVRYAPPLAMARFSAFEERLHQTLNHHLLLDVHPRAAMALAVMVVLACGMTGLLIGEAWLWFLVAAIVGSAIPVVILKQLEIRRTEQLERQLVDGVMTLASALRAGLNLVQSIEVLVLNHRGPIQQEFRQLLNEYRMGMDLNQAMRHAANRIGLSNYRLLFTAIEMHRLRGGDAAESMDRIAESIREIQRLEGKLEALTAQGRAQARMMAAAPLLILVMFYAIDPVDVGLLFSTPSGRLILLAALVMMGIGFVWIRRIMDIDI